MHPLTLPALATLAPYEVILWGYDKQRPLYRLCVQAFSEDEARTDGLAAFRRSSSAGGLAPPHVHSIEVRSGSRVTPQQRQNTLFEDLAQACLGWSMDDVQGAAVNLLLTSVQRRAGNLADAERRWNELAGRGLEALRRRFAGSGDARDAAVESDIAKRIGA